MPIRAVDMYGIAATGIRRVGANRGASGIDGTIASAVGFAAGLNLPTTCLIGDLALLHDLNSLPLTNRLTTPFVVVVLNNRGGHIFRSLPIAAYGETFERYFVHPHDYSFRQAAEMFGLSYATPSSYTDFEAVYCQAISRPVPTLIEIILDGAADYAEHRRIRDTVAAALNARSSS
jgi:2-succinyl-5-enolpyruvyl-6-hydroxy-3-cyclohexene-1-carboxylate synthase